MMRKLLLMLNGIKSPLKGERTNDSKAFSFGVRTKVSLLSLFALCFTAEMNAQFYGGEQVYCYQYVKTVNDGVTSKLDDRTMFYFVNFQNDMMGYTTESSLSQVRQRVLEDPDYYKERAIKNLADSYNRYKKSPSGLPTMGPFRAEVTLIKYCSEYSSSKNTYRKAQAYACHSGNIWDTYGFDNFWSSLSWREQCYTFSRDRSELIGRHLTQKIGITTNLSMWNP